MTLRYPDDYNVVMVDFPGDVLAAVRQTDEGYYTIYINDRLSLQAKREALKHELNHIMQGDHDNRYTIYDVEKRACASKQFPSINLKANVRFLDDGAFMSLFETGATLMVDVFGPVPCTEPLWMPDNMFDRDPDRWINRKAVW